MGKIVTGDSFRRALLAPLPAGIVEVADQFGLPDLLYQRDC
jgi:hypothetical protein